MTTDPSDSERMQHVAARALDEDDFRDRMKADPKSELANAGLTIPGNVKVEVLENTSTKLHIVLPSRLGPTGQPLLADGSAFQLLNRWPI